MCMLNWIWLKIHHSKSTYNNCLKFEVILWVSIFKVKVHMNLMAICSYYDATNHFIRFIWLATVTLLLKVLISTVFHFQMKSSLRKTMTLIRVYSFFFHHLLQSDHSKCFVKEVVTKWYYCDCLLAINWDARAKTWHESTNFSSCANFSFTFRFYSASIERDYNTHTHTHNMLTPLCQSQYVYGRNNVSAHLMLPYFFFMVSTDFLTTKPLQWPQVMLLHFVRHRIQSNCIHIEHMFVGYKLRKFLGLQNAKLEHEMAKHWCLNAKNWVPLLCMVFQSHFK